MSRVGLVLGAGGGIGRAFHAGVLAALREVWRFDARDAEIIVGTSAGSVDGAFLRAGVSPEDLLARIADRPLSRAGRRIFARLPAWVEPDEEGPPVAWRPASAARLRAIARRPWSVVPQAMGTIFAAVMPEGRRPTRLIQETVTALHPQRWPRRDLWVCAVRLDDGERVVFGRDGGASARVGEAVAASCAIPGYFTPVRIGGERYVDGGVHSPSNADVVAGLGLDLVVISSPMTAEPRSLRLSSDAAFRAACRVLLRRETARLRRDGTQVALVEPTADDVVVMGSVAESMSAAHRGDVARRIFESTVRRLRQGPLATAVETGLA